MLCVAMVTHCWAMMSGMLSGWYARCMAGTLCPVRVLNMGRVERGGGTPSLVPAMSRSSLVLPTIVWWWYSCSLEEEEEREREE